MKEVSDKIVVISASHLNLHGLSSKRKRSVFVERRLAVSFKHLIITKGEVVE